MHINSGGARGGKGGGGGGGGGHLPPPKLFSAPPLKKIISHWERLKATQAFCRYRKMYGL
jgi:hypothetical protein